MRLLEGARNRPRGIITVPVLTDCPFAHLPRARRCFPDGIAVRKGQKGWGGKPLRAYVGDEAVDSSQVIGGYGTSPITLDENRRIARIYEDSRCRWAVRNLQGSACEGGGEAGEYPGDFVVGDDGPDPGRHVEMIVIVAHVGSFACAHEPSWKKCLRPYAGMIRIRCVGRRIASLSAPRFWGSRASRHTLHPIGFIIKRITHMCPAASTQPGTSQITGLVPRSKVDAGARLPHVRIVNHRRHRSLHWSRLRQRRVRRRSRRRAA